MAERVHRRPAPKMFEGQNPPKLEMYEQDNLDWYQEQLDRARNGYSFRGDSFTGDQWWYYNFCPLTGYKLDKNGKPTDEFDMIWPYWSQDDDYIHKQIWEAKQAKLAVGLMTGRGYGKTYIVVSIGNSIFYLKKGSSSIISASIDLHADATWKKFQDSIRAVNEKHPTIALNLLKEGTSDDEIISGDRIEVNGKMKGVPYSTMQKIVYGNSPGKTKGNRYDFQHLEEFGDWSGAATLKECIAASEGTWKVGSVVRARVFYTGTGGTVKSAQAKDIAFNPEAYGIYPVREWGDRPTIIIVPAWRKRGGFWEKTGFTDEAASKADLAALREIKKLDPDPTIFQKFTQEYPDNPEEMFAQAGTNRFPVAKISERLANLEMNPEHRAGEFGSLEWIRKDGEIVGVEWIPSNDGNMWQLEPPRINPATGKAYKNLYTAGYDGIDLGAGESTAGTSRGSMCVKKRFLNTKESSNVYTFFYVERPDDANDFFDNCYKIMVYHNLIEAVNIEFSKIAIYSYLKTKKATKYFMRRPRITFTKADQEGVNESNMIGTTPHEKNFQFGENFLIQYLKSFLDNLFYLPAMADLVAFRMENRGKHDITVSMFMCELGDDEMADRPIDRNTTPVIDETEYGYFKDREGNIKWGEIQRRDPIGMHFGQDPEPIRHLDRRK